MQIPEFIRAIRGAVGNQLLLLPGVSAVVLDNENRVLLGRRADTGRWAVPSGIPEPGEEPAEAAVREIYEECGVRCTPERVASVRLGDPITYSNGDRCQYITINFRCRYAGGEARVHDDESIEVAWFRLGRLPSLDTVAAEAIEHAMAEGDTWFARCVGIP